MKYIPLRELAGESEEIPAMNYQAVLREVTRHPLDPRQGIDIAEMRQSLRVLDAIDAANGTLELEDADYQHLKQKLLAMPWGMVDRRILQLVDEVLAADDGLRKGEQG
jgi:hypothetical protein